jgi:hypothetical protein
LIVAALFIVNRAGLAGNIAFFGVAALLAVRGYEGVARAISLMALVMVGNVFFVTRAEPGFGVMKFGLLLLAVVCVLTELRGLGVRLRERACYQALWVFIIAAALLALIVDSYLLVSLSKLFAFGMGFTLILGLSELAARRKDDLSSWFVPFIGFVVLASGTALALGVGFNAKTTMRFASGLFNGVMYHPQTFGPACALMVVYLFCLGRFTAYKRRWVLKLLTVCLLVCLLLSSSRTGTIALLAGLTVAIVYYLASQRGATLVARLKQSGSGVEIVAIFCCLALVVVDTASQGKLRERVAAFATKTLHTGHYDIYRDRALDRIIFSRKGQVGRMVENIREHPTIGIGFGVSTSARFESRMTLVSAPTEKGFLPLAVVEETGFVGALFFVLFIGAVYRDLIQRRNGPGMAMFSALLGANVGEMMFFSFGGHGLLMWIMVGAGLIMGAPTGTGE